MESLAKSGAPSVFITLTVNPAVGIDRADRARTLVKAWRLIVKRAKKRHGYKHIAYFCVFEATKAGEPHLHILSTVPWLDQKWLSRQMDEIAGAPIVDIRKVRSVTHAARYIAKYVGKAPHKFGTLKRYWHTRGWDLTPYKPEPDPGFWSSAWTPTDKTLEALQEEWEFQGWTCTLTKGRLHGWGDVPLWGQPETLQP